MTKRRHQMGTPVLSIITVCYQAKDQFCTTAENLLCQSWKNFEYIVVDGASNDGTKELFDFFAPLFERAQIPFSSISESDRGIYDAMNKGTRMASGRWLLFLNAGDILADRLILERIFQSPSDAQVIYGDTDCIYQGHLKRYPALPLDRLTCEMAFCHQSAFIQRERMLAHPYDISYKVCADHHFFLSLYLEGYAFDYRPLPVSVYEISGYSDRNKLLSHREKHRMQKELGIFHLSPGWLLQELRFYLKEGIKALFGQRLIDLVRRKRLG